MLLYCKLGWVEIVSKISLTHPKMGYDTKCSILNISQLPTHCSMSLYMVHYVAGDHHRRTSN